MVWETSKRWKLMIIILNEHSSQTFQVKFPQSFKIVLKKTDEKECYRD